MTAIALKTLCHEFVEVAGPYLNINEQKRYVEAIERLGPSKSLKAMLGLTVLMTKSTTITIW